MAFGGVPEEFPEGEMMCRPRFVLHRAFRGGGLFAWLSVARQRFSRRSVLYIARGALEFIVHRAPGG